MAPHLHVRILTALWIQVLKELCVAFVFFLVLWMLHRFYVILKCISNSKSLEQYQKPQKR